MPQKDYWPVSGRKANDDPMHVQNNGRWWKSTACLKARNAKGGKTGGWRLRVNTDGCKASRRAAASWKEGFRRAYYIAHYDAGQRFYQSLGPFPMNILQSPYATGLSVASWLQHSNVQPVVRLAYFQLLLTRFALSHQRQSTCNHSIQLPKSYQTYNSITSMVPMLLGKLVEWAALFIYKFCVCHCGQQQCKFVKH